MDFFREIHVFLQVIWTVLFGTKWAFLHLENWDWVYEFLSELTQLSEGKLGLHAHALTNMVFLSSAPCVSSTYVNRTIWGKETLSVPWKIYVEKVFISEETQFPRESKGLRCLLLTQKVFFQEIHMSLQLNWKYRIGTNVAYLYLEF
jgi:hypothetical protein